MADMGLQIGFSHSTSRVHFTPVHTFKYFPDTFGVSPVAQSVKNLPTMQETGSDPWIGKIPCRRKWQSIPVFSPGEFHREEPEGLVTVQTLSIFCEIKMLILFVNNGVGSSY